MRRDYFKKNYIDSECGYVSLYNLERMNQEQKRWLRTNRDPYIIVPCPWEPCDDTYVKLHDVLDTEGNFLPDFKQEYL